MTLLALVQRMGAELDAAAVAFGHGTDNAFDEAAWLTLWKLGLPLDALDEQAQRAVTPAETAAVEALVRERIHTRKPAAYLIGTAWLHGLEFHVDERVIVPRSLIAEPLVEGMLEDWLGHDPRQVLDLCTGNGSLAVMAALAWPGCSVVATDLSAPALEVAALNIARHGVQPRVALRQGDGLAALQAQDRFDLVLCNPPYVNAAAMQALPAEFRAEPTLALAGGADGMDFVRRLLAGIAPHLAAGGALVLEIGHERAHFEAAFPQLEPLWLPTSAGDDAVLLLTAEALGAA